VTVEKEKVKEKRVTQEGLFVSDLGRARGRRIVRFLQEERQKKLEREEGSEKEGLGVCRDSQGEE